MNYYPSHSYRSLSRQQLSQTTSVLPSIVTCPPSANHANPQTLTGHDERRIFAKRGLALVSYAISAGISGGAWLGVYRTVQHFMK